MTGKAAALALILGTSVFVVPGASADWASYRNDALRTGNQPQGSPLSDPKAVVNLAVTHSFPAGSQGEGGSFEAAPVVAANVEGVESRVLIGSTSGFFYALDSISLNKLWQYPTTAPLLGNCIPDNGGNGTFGRYGIHASATLAQIGGQNAVAFGAPDPTAEAGHGSARLFALNVIGGTPIWKADGVHDGSAVVAHVQGCTPGAPELHERIANSSPLVLGNKVYIGVHDSGDDPLQKGKVVAVDLATGKLLPFNYVSTGTPLDNTRGGGVWNSPAGDGTSVYFTTGNTNPGPPYILPPPLPEPSPNHGLSMVSVDRDTGNVNWAFQPVPYAIDGDPDWAAGAAVAHASCGTVITSVMKDGWAYGVKPDGSCKWQFPQTAPAPPSPQACIFPTNDKHLHADTGYRQSAAVFEDKVIIRTGGENLINDGVSGGYARLVALDACAADDAHRVKWLTDPLVPTSNSADPNANCTANPSENEFALGTPTVTNGIIYVTANEADRCDQSGNQFAGNGHVLAIADPTVLLPLTTICSNPKFSAIPSFGGRPSDCVNNGYSVVPDPGVLADVALPDQGDAVHLRKEPAIANGRVYVATSMDGLHPQGGHVYVLEAASPPPPPSVTISVSMTETQIGPDICINGQGFTSPGPAQISYMNIPQRPTPSTPAPSTSTPMANFLRQTPARRAGWLRSPAPMPRSNRM